MLTGPKQRKRTRRPARAHLRAGSPKCTRTFKTCVKRRALCKTLVSLGKTRCKHNCEPKSEPVRIDYTFGHDEIVQSVDDGTTKTTHVFGHDSHGSVRIVYDLSAAAQIEQAYTFAAYGEMLAVHGADAVAVPVVNAVTSLGYSGEHFDAKAQQQYLRARFYNPANGRFNRLDPFAGNMQDPQSLHKYAYVHGDPIQNIDPSGNLSMAMSVAIGMTIGTIGWTSYLSSEVFRRPTWKESLIPVVGPGWDAVANFQRGEYFWGTLNTVLAVADLFVGPALLRWGASAIGRKAAASSANAAVQATKIKNGGVVTKVREKDIVKISGEGVYRSGVEGRVYGALAPVKGWLHHLSLGMLIPPGGQISWAGKLSDFFQPHAVEGWYSGLKRMFGHLRTPPGNIELLVWEEIGSELIVWEAKLVAKGTAGHFVGRVRELTRIAVDHLGLKGTIAGAEAYAEHIDPEGYKLYIEPEVKRFLDRD